MIYLCWLGQCTRRFTTDNMILLLLSVLAVTSATREKLPAAPFMELNDGNKIPMIALGTGRSTVKPGDSLDDVRNAVQWAIEVGYRHIDTAAIYDDEKQVGEGIANATAEGVVEREDLFVTTKLWSDKHAPAQVVPALRESLSKLGLDYVDLYLIHFPVALKSDGTADNIDYLETWKGMEEARKLGLTKSIGVSNFNSTQIDRLLANCNIKPVVNEIEVNPTNTQIKLVKHCQNVGVAVMAYSPFGFLVSRRQANGPPPQSVNPSIGAIAASHGRTVGQIVLRYLVDRGLIPIPKSFNIDRIIQNFDIFDFRLTKDEVDIINHLNKDARVILTKEWADYPNYPF